MKEVKPYKPRNPVVAPYNRERMRFDSSERQLFDAIAQEHVGICGTTVEFYSLRLDRSNRDALYDESVDRVFQGAFKLSAWVSYPDNTVSVSDRGATGQWSGKIWFPRKELEDKNAPIPSEGDVFRMWRIPYWTDASVDPEEAPETIPGRGLYFTITNVDEDGVMFDNPDFVGISCDYARKSEFTPERRLGNR